MIGQTLWLEFFTNSDWPVASAIAVVLLVLLLAPLLLYDRLQRRQLEEAVMARARSTGLSPFNVTSLALGLAFLYLPIVDSRDLFVQRLAAGDGVGRLVAALVRRIFQRCARCWMRPWMSLRVGAVSATVATMLGTLAAVALTRGERFRGRTLFSGMLYAPLVMPEVITGLSLLLLFVAINAERGFWTVTIAHTTLTMCFVAVVVQSRLGSLDRSLEEAAMDLGCDPLRAFVAVTLPLILPVDRRGLDAGLHAVAGRPGDRELHHRARLGDAADPDLFGGAARREARDQRDLHIDHRH